MLMRFFYEDLVRCAEVRRVVKVSRRPPRETGRRITGAMNGTLKLKPQSYHWGIRPKEDTVNLVE